MAIELARHGIEVYGTDLDSSMLATARQLAPEIRWTQANLAELNLGRTFDVVVMAGNVPLFTPVGTQEALVAGVARHVRPGEGSSPASASTEATGSPTTTRTPQRPGSR